MQHNTNHHETPSMDVRTKWNYSNIVLSAVVKTIADLS